MRKRVAAVLQELEDRARVLSHQDRVRRVVVDAELVADTVLLADAMQRDPRARRVGDVVVPVVAGRPSRHRALLDAIGESALLDRFQDRNEVILEVHEVLVHAVLLIAADEAADGVHAQEHRGVENLHQEVALLLARGPVVMQQVVEVGEVRDADAARLHGAADPPRAGGVEGLAQVERVGHRVEHRFGRHVGLGRDAAPPTTECGSRQVHGRRRASPRWPGRDPRRASRAASAPGARR